MKRYIVALIALISYVFLGAQEIHDVTTTVAIHLDGSAHVKQVWDATVSRGTEWYIPVDNLDKMDIRNFRVFEHGQEYINEGDGWDTDRSLDQKAFRCGIVRKRGGVELCWGQGDYGRHVWTAEYDVVGLVKGMEDYDGFNYMFVNPNIGKIAQANVTIVNETGFNTWTSDNVKVWAFGFEGNIEVRDGKILCTATSMPKSHKIIVLARFDKGLINPVVTLDSPFENMRKKAFRGSDYDSDESDNGFMAALLALIPMLAGLFAVVWAIFMKATGRVSAKKIYGTNKVEGWWHEPPQEKNLYASFYILQKGELLKQGGHEMDLIGAMFLKWVLEKKAVAIKDEKHPKRYNLQLKATLLFDDSLERELYDMALEAAGDNQILESKEFEKWTRRNVERIYEWPKEVLDEGKRYLIDKGRLDAKGHSTEEGFEEACHVLQFRNYLKDFTLNNEREVPEVALWKDYLVFAQLYGIADQVAAQLQKLYPADFERYARQFDMDPYYLNHLILMNRSMSTNAYSKAVNTTRSSGGGGFSSIGGGGGFSGGGFGGGSR